MIVPLLNWQRAEVVNTSKIASYHIVFGDFNAAINAVEIGAFINQSRAIDCYAADHGPEPRYSLANAFTKNNKRICVDHIFALPVANMYPAFINSAVVLNEPDKQSGLYASDHFGISTTFVTHNF
ncbi:hypothetical protein [Mucilaginibacter sp. SP1R1]|uniref:hypothetical protein n=1 Tax=Mucilaginibacter sp. SP1R1 TaxID=2723091 RepID=UPI001620B5A8|nr:hypothetical protein [Mucilaginibacter sp. SP1R1]MBB6151166.1 endonuclease/exonuclease/phosphatase family metal-dependent hydrolase [Mucilaginibacter sp. SP1R1]